MGLHEVAAFRCRKRARKGQCLSYIKSALMNGRLLRCAPDGSLPSEQEKVVTAESAPAGLEKPLESRLHGISDAYPSIIDGSAMRAARGEEPYGGADHELTSAFTAWVAAGPARFGDGVQ